MPMNDRPKPKSKVEEALESASVANMVCQQQWSLFMGSV